MLPWPKKEASTDPETADVKCTGKNQAAISWGMMRRRLCLSRKVWVKELREAPKAWDWKGAEHNLSLICLRAVLDRLESLAEQAWAGGTVWAWHGWVRKGKLQHGQLLNLQTQMSRAETRGTFTTASSHLLEQHVPLKKKGPDKNHTHLLLCLFHRR